MVLRQITLQHFRSYTKTTFDFDKQLTVIVGKNTSGKSNLIESLFLLASGKSFRAEKDIDMIQFSQNLARVTGTLDTNGESTKLEVLISQGLTPNRIYVKKFLVNGVPKRGIDFVSHVHAVLFSPVDLQIISDSAGTRRKFFDTLLSQVDRPYRQALTIYTKALRHRNALLQLVQETGTRNERQFDYWDELLIVNGQYINKKRKEFLDFVNSAKKDIFAFLAVYDESTISPERLLQYKDAEVGAGVTLVGPHRDDFSLQMFHEIDHTTRDVRQFGSRGQQRMAILQLKVLELSYMEQAFGYRPLLLLDDIFSELDHMHIHVVLEMVGEQQTIITTTHKEFLENFGKQEMKMIELGK